MSEGSLEAPARHAIDWNNPDFTDPAKLDAEMRRVFDICHGCRRCFNLCDSFPRLFDLVDNAPSEELDTVDSSGFDGVVEACTLCDLCFMTKCPYVPPHEFDLDFPHLMLRYRYAEHKAGRSKRTERELTETDRNSRLAGIAPAIANWASNVDNTLTRTVMEKTVGLHRDAALPAFVGTPLVAQAKANPAQVNATAPAYGRKAVIYATCFGNYNEPDIGLAARAVFAKNGVKTEITYAGCCGMPQLESGDIPRVAEQAKTIAAEMMQWIDDGYDVIALLPSCALMLKFEWPLLVPDDENIRRLSKATRDVAEYVVEIAKNEGLADGLEPLDGNVTMHLACHARAQNMGPKAVQMLRLIPETRVAVIERCSGHGGSWGAMKDNFEVALKVGKPVAGQAVKALNQAAEKGATQYVASECPLAGQHIVQGIERADADAKITHAPHPIKLFAQAYGLDY
jgi:glycerol-3-phosphate dehydrogenase subunit C